MATKQQWMIVDGNPRDGWHDVKWESGKARVRFDETSKVSDVWIEKPTPEKLRRLPLHRIELTAGAGGGIAANRRYQLRRPARRRLGPEFYANVATAYRAAVARGMQPRKTLAADTGKADATVAAWIMEARKRGYLPPAEPGKVSA